MTEQQKPDEKQYWLDQPSTGDLIFWGLVAICIGITVVDLVFHRHTHFKFEEWFGFYAFFGFIASIGLILLAKQMRKVLKREENYYDR